MLAQKLLGAMAGGTEDKLYVDDVFSAYTYTGNDSTQTINNGIDLAGEGGLVWIKSRKSDRHSLSDTINGAGNYLSTNLTSALTAGAESVYSFLSNGFTVNTNGSVVNNSSFGPYMSWTFRKAPKFFDVVTYTGTGAASRSIAHSLGIAPGMIIVKRTDAAGVWYAFHRYDETKYSMLNGTEGFYAFGSSMQFASDSFSVEGINTNGASYVAYLFAHDTSADGIVQCGSVTTNGSGAATVNLGWEPQYILHKWSTTTSNWEIYDSTRGLVVDGGSGTGDKYLRANTSDAEGGTYLIDPSSTGFSFTGGAASQTSVYLAIRRPNKPPTTGTQVYNANLIASGVAATAPFDVGFPMDMSVYSLTDFENTANNHRTFDRLRGGSVSLNTSSASAELNDGGYQTARFDLQNSAVIEVSSLRRVIHNFKRATGFFDVVCYTGTGSAQMVNHSLGVAPEMVIVKGRSSGYWVVYSAPTGAAGKLRLNDVSAFSSDTLSGDYPWNSTVPTASVFSLGAVGNYDNWNLSGYNYVAYLFASLPGISKVGTYVGNGSSQTINCGFSAGARFVMVKATSTSGDWLVADASRGIIAGNDPRLSLNTTSAEVTTEDWLDPDSTGFIVNQVAGSSANASGVSYIFLAIS